MRMLSVCYVKVKGMLNKCKVGMLSLGYGNVKTRLRQNCSFAYASAWNSDSYIGQGSHIYGSWRAES